MELHEIDEDGNEVVSKVEEVQPGKKTSADLVESILGLVYLHKGFEASFDICEEMGITLPRDDVYETTIPHYKRKEDLMAFGEKFLGGMKFTHPELLEEAVTHPSCIHEEVPCYQRLEWFGDAVLCLYAREWIYKQYMDLEVGELVILEATVVCNETLAYVCVSNGLQRHLNHRDPSLPPKIAEFEHSMGPKGRGLWATGETNNSDRCNFLTEHIHLLTPNFIY
jgi:dsRNA-specific ribonuclease